MEFNSAFKGLRQFPTADAFDERAEKLCTLQNIKSPNVVSFLDWFISGGTTSWLDKQINIRDCFDLRHIY